MATPKISLPPELARKPSTPKASRKKKAAFTFHLLQPFFQFGALLFVVLALTNCSPLAPSATKSSFMEGSGGGVHGMGLKSEAQEQAIEASLQDVSLREAKLVSESEFRKVTEDVKSAEDSLDEGAARALVERRESRGTFSRRGKILFFNLTAEQSQALLKDGKVRVNLSERLNGARAEAKNILVRHLDSEQKKGRLDASGYLVMPDAVIKRGNYRDLALELKVAFGAPVDGAAYLELTRANDEPIDAALLDGALRDLRQLAIVLE